MFTLQSIPPQPEASPDNARAAKLNGFSLLAGVAARADQRGKIERLCLYIARPGDRGEAPVTHPYRQGTL